MSKAYPHIIPNPEDWPIYKQAKNRSSFIGTLNNFTFNRVINNQKDLERLLNMTVYQEGQRVKNNPWKVDPADDKKYWDSIRSELRDINTDDPHDERYQKIIKRIINRYNVEIVGDFKPKTFFFIRKFLTAFFKRLFNKMIVRGTWRFWGTKDQLFDKIKVSGPVEHIRELYKKGTVIVLPTHFSNLDSIMVGYTLDNICGIPPFTYGAGLNLFDYEIPAYFMNRLGAYRLDRRKKNPIYLECLKAMNSLSIYQGVNSIFFPGGTRSRSGKIESRLKLGLVGSVVQAQRRHIEYGDDKKIFMVPMILDYHFVLEAKSLINQHLKIEGKENYVRPKTAVKGIRANFRFLKALYNKQSEVVISFGQPLDVMGNEVNLQGESIDEKNEVIDFTGYFSGEANDIERNNQREKIYTRLLGDKLVTSYRRNNIALSSNILAFAAFELYRSVYQKSDFYTFLVTPLDELVLPLDEFKSILKQCVEYLEELKEYKEIKLSEHVKSTDIDQLIFHGLRNLGLYHANKVLYLKKDIVKTQDLTLLYYYRNKLDGYKIEERVRFQISNQKV